MQTQTQPSSTDILQQFSDMLKSHSIIVSDRENLVKLLENIVDLCTQMPKTKLKAAVKAASNPAPAKKAPAKKAPAKKQEEKLVGPAEAADCPMITDIKPTGRGRGRPRKDASAAVMAPVNSIPAAEAEKKKRGRPKKDKTMVVSSNADEDALIAKMIADVRSLKNDEDLSRNATTSSAIVDDDETESETEEDVEVSLSPVCATVVCEVPDAVEADHEVEVLAAKVNTNAGSKVKAAKETKVKAAKEPKAKAAKEPKAKAVKESSPLATVATVASTVASTVIDASDVIASATSAAPLRENKAGSDGKFYLMSNYPRSSFSYSGKTYLRTENDNVYDNLTHELVGVWDHLNHEIITTSDDEEEELEELWMSDEE